MRWNEGDREDEMEREGKPIFFVCVQRKCLELKLGK